MAYKTRSPYPRQSFNRQGADLAAPTSLAAALFRGGLGLGAEGMYRRAAAVRRVGARSLALRARRRGAAAVALDAVVGEHLELDLAGDVGVVAQVLLGVLAPLADAV